MGFASAFFRQLPAWVMIDEQIELAYAVGDSDEAEALVTQGRPARNPEQLGCRQRGLDAFGQPEPPAARPGEPDRGVSEAPKGTARPLECGQARFTGFQKRAMQRDDAGVVADRRNHRREELDAFSGAKRRLRMIPQIRASRCDSATGEVAFGRTSGENLRLAPQP